MARNQNIKIQEKKQAEPPLGMSIDRWERLLKREQELKEAEEDEEILNEMQEYFRGGIEEKRESAGELLEYIRMLDKQGVRKSGMGEGKSQAELIPPRVVEMMLNNQIFEKEAKQLYHVLVKYGLYEATDKTWRTNLKKAR